MLQDAHVPFRNSKLTQMLADSLGGAAKVRGLDYLVGRHAVWKDAC